MVQLQAAEQMTVTKDTRSPAPAVVRPEHSLERAASTPEKGADDYRVKENTP